MAWFCSGRSNTELVQRLRSAHVITSERVKEVRVFAGDGTGTDGREGRGRWTLPERRGMD